MVAVVDDDAVPAVAVRVDVDMSMGTAGLAYAWAGLTQGRQGTWAGSWVVALHLLPAGDLLAWIAFCGRVTEQDDSIDATPITNAALSAPG